MDDFYQGNTVTIVVTITQNDVAVDITGSTITFTMKKKKEDTALIQKVAVLTDPTNGQATITLTDAETDVDPDEYLFDIEWINVTSQTKTLIDDTVNVLQPVKEA